MEKVGIISINIKARAGINHVALNHPKKILNLPSQEFFLKQLFLVFNNKLILENIEG